MVSKIRVLVVDDAGFMREMVRRGVRTAYPAFQVDEAVNGKKALTLLDKNEYDLVLCDWEMPEMSGAELLQWLRENEATQDIPFVMVTSRGDRDNVMEAVQLKVSNYIVKPFTNEKLAKVVESVLTKAKGISPMELKQLGGVSKSSSFGNDSVSILTASSSQESTAEPVEEERAPGVVRPTGKVIAALRFSNETVNCLVREISRERVKAVVRRADSIPGILELAVLDIQVGGAVARLNSFVHTLQARDNSPESEFVDITVNLVDQDDEEKMSLLERYMASIAGA